MLEDDLIDSDELRDDSDVDSDASPGLINQ
jgi:hypothetical protein